MRQNVSGRIPRLKPPTSTLTGGDCQTGARRALSALRGPWRSRMAPMAEVGAYRRWCCTAQGLPRQGLPCAGEDVFQGDAHTPGRCGCEGEQHSYLLPSLGALMHTFFPEIYSKVCGSIGNPSYEKLGRCVCEVEGVQLTLGLRAVNGTRVRNAILGVRSLLSLAWPFSTDSLPFPPRTTHPCSVLRVYRGAGDHRHCW